MEWYCPAAAAAAAPLMAWLRRRKKQNARPTRTSTATGMPTPRPIFRALESSEPVDGADEGELAESLSVWSESSSEFWSEGLVVADADSDADSETEVVSDKVVDSEDDLVEVRVLLVLVVTASVAEDVLSERPVGARVYLETPFVGG
jgi:hypothetical protein